MNGEALFLEKLNGLLTLAKEYGGQITIEEVKAYFSEDALTEEQMDLVFEYLMTQKISVKGYVKMGSQPEEEFSEEEKIYLKEYEETLSAIKTEGAGEVHSMVQQAIKGDASAKARLVELYMEKVLDVAKELYSPDVFLGDLVQEGNLGLVLGVDMITDEATADKVILGQVRQCMQLLLEEQSELASRDKKMVEKVQALDESITTLTEELGRKVSIEELAVYMGVEIEEIEDILKLAGEETEPEEQE